MSLPVSRIEDQGLLERSYRALDITTLIKGFSQSTKGVSGRVLVGLLKKTGQGG
jgi:hypothetical protein